MSLKTEESNILAGYPRILAGIYPGCPKGSETENCVFNVWPPLLHSKSSIRACCKGGTSEQMKRRVKNRVNTNRRVES